MPIIRFSISLDTEHGPFTFSFHPINIRDKQLYQVYTNYNQSELRFHMQVQNSGSFYITDKTICPAFIASLEAQLSDAIITN